MDYIKLELSATECNGWPKCNFYIDSDLIEDYEFSSSAAEITLPLELLDGDHVLTVELYGKTTKNTKVENNKIIQDQLVTLENIIVNNIKLPDFCKYLGVYSYSDQIIPQGLTWGVNGQWNWEFKMPIIAWILDRKIADQELHYPPAVTYLERIELERKQIMRFSEQLNKL